MSVKNLLKIHAYIFFTFFWINFAYAKTEKESSAQSETVQIAAFNEEGIVIEDNEGNTITESVTIYSIAKLVKEGKPVHFIEGQDEKYRTIRTEWILEAIGNDNDIDIENAIIDGNEDLDLRIEEKLVNIESDDLKLGTKIRLRKHSIEQVFLIKSRISIRNSIIKKSFTASVDKDLEALVVFANNIDFTKTKFNGEYIDFFASTFDGEETFFGKVVFNAESINFGRAVFNGKDTYFWGAVFNAKLIQFYEAEFNAKETNFMKTVFNGEYIEFFESTFNGKETSFYKTEFKGEYTTFWKSEFNGEETDFSFVDFNGRETYFTDVVFSARKTIFRESVFNNEITSFTNSMFNGKEAIFEESVFNGKVTSFIDVVFNSETTKFNDIVFSGVSFKNSIWSKTVYFNNSVFNDYVDFSNTQLQDAFFLGCIFSGYLYLYRARYNAIYINWKPIAEINPTTTRTTGIHDGALYNGRDGVIITESIKQLNYPTIARTIGALDGALYNGRNGIIKSIKQLNDIVKNEKKANPKRDIKDILKEELNKNNALYINLKADNHTQWQSTYLRLIKNFEDIGFTTSANDAYYHYRLIKPVFKTVDINIDGKNANVIIGQKTKWIERIFFGWTCGYGVKPFWALRVAGLLILLFTFIYFVKKGSIEYRQTKKGFENIRKEIRNDTENILIKHRVLDANLIKIESEDIKNEISKKWYYGLYNCFYFSVMTFSTVGYGDYCPVGTFKLVAMVEGILGWLTMALFLVTLGNVWL